jgi:hypothetical protein
VHDAEVGPELDTLLGELPYAAIPEHVAAVLIRVARRQAGGGSS